MLKYVPINLSALVFASQCVKSVPVMSLYVHRQHSVFPWMFLLFGPSLLLLTLRSPLSVKPISAMSFCAHLHHFVFPPSSPPLGSFSHGLLKASLPQPPPLLAGVSDPPSIKSVPRVCKQVSPLLPSDSLTQRGNKGQGHHLKADGEDRHHHNNLSASISYFSLHLSCRPSVIHPTLDMSYPSLRFTGNKK